MINNTRIVKHEWTDIEEMAQKQNLAFALSTLLGDSYRLSLEPPKTFLTVLCMNFISL